MNGWYEQGRVRADSYRDAIDAVLNRYGPRLLRIHVIRYCPQPGMMEYLVELVRSEEVAG